MNLIYETERTKVRLFSENYIADAYEFMSDPIVAKYEYWSPYSYDDTKQEINKLSQIVPRSIGKWNEFVVEIKKRSQSYWLCLY